MAGTLEPLNGRALGPGWRAVAGRTSRALDRLEHQHTIREAHIVSEGILAAAKVREIQAVAREAVVGHAALARFASVCAGDDVFEKDALAFFLDLAKLGAGQVIAELSESLSRRSGW